MAIFNEAYIAKRNDNHLMEFFHNIDMEYQQAIHEYEMSILQDKYNYICEYGVFMEADTEKKSIISNIMNFIKSIINQIKKIFEAVSNRIKEIINKNRHKDPDKAKKIEEVSKKYKEKTDETVDDLDARSREAIKYFNSDKGQAEIKAMQDRISDWAQKRFHAQEEESKKTLMTVEDFASKVSESTKGYVDSMQKSEELIKKMEEREEEMKKTNEDMKRALADI